MANLKDLNEVLLDYWSYLIDLGLENMAAETAITLNENWR